MADNVCALVHSYTKSSSKLLFLGRRLADASNSYLVAVAMGTKAAGCVDEVAKNGADEVLVADSEVLNRYDADLYVRLLLKVIDATDPKFVLLPFDHVGMDLAPKLAARLGVGCVSNCVDVLCEGGEVYFVQSTYRGKIQAKISLGNARPLVASLQEASLPAPSPRIGRGLITPVDVQFNSSEAHVRILDTLGEGKREDDAALKADTIVSGGRGIGSKENYRLIEELANVLGGVPACSKALVDLGWLPQSYQVGMTGKTVSPKLYVACGISGDVFHIVGMKASKVVVAINKDPSAPIFNHADYGIVGDLNDVLPALIEEAKKLLER